MKLVFAQNLKRILRWTQRVLFAGAFAMLACCGFVLADTWVFQNRELGQLDRLLADRRAVGHIPGTVLPGRPGNVGISGHRDTFFRPSRNIRRNDLITLTMLSGEFRYRVVSTKVVGPNDLAVLDPGESEILTLVTCYPFYFVGSAPARFIVRAERVGNVS